MALALERPDIQVEVGGVVCPQLGQKVSPVWETQQRETSLPRPEGGHHKRLVALPEDHVQGW